MKTIQVTHDTLPKAVEKMYEMLYEIEQRLKATPPELLDDLITIEEAAEMLRLKKQTIYQYVHDNTIPHSKIKRKLYFSKRELTNWILNSKTEAK